MLTNLSAAALGEELREGTSPFLKRRRSIVKLALFSSAVLGGIALYQMGVLKKLPQPRWRWFDAQKVNGSPQAYSILATPDALLGLVSYAMTACWAGVGSEKRWQTQPVLSIGMGLKVLADAAFASKLTADECTKFRSFSLWSLLVTGATFTALPLALPEARAALGALTGKNPA